MTDYRHYTHIWRISWAAHGKGEVVPINKDPPIEGGFFTPEAYKNAKRLWKQERDVAKMG